MRRADGLRAIARLTDALKRARGEDVVILADGYCELADRTEAYLTRETSPEDAALKTHNAIARRT